MFRRSVLIVAFVICLPVLWGALVDQSVTLDAAGIRFLIALPVAAILVGIVRLAARPTNTATDDHSHTAESTRAEHTGTTN